MSGLVVDTLVFCGEHAAGWTYDLDDVRRDGARAGVDRFVLVTPRPRDYHYGPENARIAQLVAQEPDLLYGLVRVDPMRGEEAVLEVERSLGEHRLHGLFLHPAEEQFGLDDPQVDALVAVADRHRAPVVVAAGFPWRSEALQVAALASRHPETAFVLTNGGQYNISGLGMQDAWAALAATPNLIIQTSGEYRQDFIEDVAVKLGPERVMFASGAPQYEPAFEVLRVRWADLPVAAVEAMLGATWLTLVARCR